MNDSMSVLALYGGADGGGEANEVVILRDTLILT